MYRFRFGARRLFASTSSASNSRNYYAILELESKPACSSKEIKGKFYELSKRYHPDMNPDDDSSHEKFLLINEAYSVLGNELKRREYDRELASTRNSFNHPSGYEGGGGGFTGYSGSGRRGTQEWSSRSYREKLNPDDFMLHRRKRGESEPFGSRPGFNFTAHQEGHYGGGGGADSVARKRMYQRMYYKQLYEERSWRNSTFPVIFLIGSSLTLLFSDFFKLLWM